jgi:Late competence development protein ComFB.
MSNTEFNQETEFIYKNLMEIVVMNKIREMESELDCCKCDQCLMDIATYVLNRIPPKYIVTTKGRIFSNLEALSIQHIADIVTLILEASFLVSESPRHLQAK